MKSVKSKSKVRVVEKMKPVEPLILHLRGQKVILDADLAQLYGVQTKALNQAIKRNADRFPEDFMFQLTADERSQFATLTEDVVYEQDTPNRSQIVTGSRNGEEKKAGSSRSQIVTATLW